MDFNLTPVQIIGIVLVINGALIGSAAQLTDLFGPVAVKYIIAVASLGNSIFGGIITMVTGQGSQIKNVLAMPGVEKIAVNGQASPTLAAMAVDPAVDKIAPTAAAIDKVTATAKAAASIILLALIMFPGDARAQGKPLPLTGNIVRDIQSATGGPRAGLTGGGVTGNAADSALAALAKPFQDIANFIGEDADRAVSLATAVPEIQDGHGQQCAMALSSFGKIIKAHPVPVTLHVVTDFEALRLLAIATNRLCANVHCTQVFADVSAMAQAASPIPLPIPALHDLCTKVPQIALVDPVPVPAADASTAPTK